MHVCNQYPDRIVGLKYHYQDPMANVETTTRNDWYEVAAYPTMYVDGIDAGWPYDPNWVDSLEHHMSIQSPLEFTTSGEYDAQTQTGIVEVAVYVEGAIHPSTDYRIVYVMAEDSVLDGVNLHYEVTRDMIPNPNSTPVTLEQGYNYTFSTDFAIDPAWNPNHCFLAVFIQDFSSKEVLQAAKVDIIDLPPPPAPAVGASTASLDFGEVEVGQSVELPLTIYSVGELPLVIHNIHANNLSFTNNWDPADSLFIPGDSLQISVFFNPVAALEFHRTLSIESNAELFTVALNGIGIPANAVNPTLSTAIPRTFALKAPYPNPFNPETMVSFDLPIASDVSLVVYDIQGRRVADLGRGHYQAGRYSATFHANSLSSGVYFIWMEVEGQAFTQKCLLIR